MKKIALMLTLVLASVSAYAETVRMATEIFVTNYVEKAISEATPRRAVAMFILPINDLGSGTWSGIELKCSTNNYTTTEYFSHTAYLDDPNGDGASVLIVKYPGYQDTRKFRNITNDPNLAELIGASKYIVVIVDASMCRRTDGKWLSEGNDQATWLWARVSWGTREQYNDGYPIWRPVAPARWLSEIPEWAK